MCLKNIVAVFTVAVASIACGVGVLAEEAVAEKVAEAMTVSVFGEADLKIPSDFKRVEPKSRILAHEFEAKTGEGKEGETARVTMMAAGGDVEANIKRWKGQFAGGDEEARKTEEMNIGKWKVHLVDVNGSYSERMGGGPFAGGKVVNRKDYGMTGAILVHPEGRKYFVKMIGPMAVVKANRKAFVTMIKSIEK